MTAIVINDRKMRQMIDDLRKINESFGPGAADGTADKRPT